MQLEDEEEISRRSRKFAADVVLEICQRSDLHVATAHGAVPMSSMTTSRTFMENLMKVAMFSGNMHQFSGFGTKDNPWKAVPVSLIGTFMIYSMKVCPVDQNGNADQKLLAETVLKLETVFGVIPTDPAIMAEICNPSASPVKSNSPAASDLEDFYG